MQYPFNINKSTNANGSTNYNVYTTIPVSTTQAAAPVNVYDNDLTPVQARNQPRFDQWFAKMEAKGCTSDQINARFYIEIDIQKEQQRLEAERQKPFKIAMPSENVNLYTNGDFLPETTAALSSNSSDFDITPEVARTQSRFAQWFTKMEANGYSTEQINTQFFAQVKIQKDQEKKIREQESVLLSQQLAEQQQKQERNRFNDIMQQQQIRFVQQQVQQNALSLQPVPSLQMQALQPQAQPILQQPLVPMQVEPPIIPQAMQSLDHQQLQRKIQMAENIVNAYDGRVRMEQLLRMSYAEIFKFHKEIVSRLNEQGFYS